jgi:hypothetical protein
MGEMSKELAVIPQGMAALCPAELGALHAALRSARIDSRKVMRHFWWHKEITHEYSAMVGDLAWADPLFGRESLVAELREERFPMKIKRAPQVK